MKKRLLACLLAATLVSTAFAACGKASTGSTGNTSPSSSKSASADASNASDNGDAGEINAPALSTQIETLKVFMPLVGGGNLDTLDNVVAEINSYIEPLIYANIDLTYIPYANWDQQINLAISSGEQVDLVDTCRQIPTFYKNGAVLPLDDLLDSYGSDTRDHVAQDFLDACTYGGALYGIPTLRDLAKQQSFEYRVDIAEQYGLEFGEYSTLEELEKQFAKLKEAAPDMTAVLMTNSANGQFSTGFGASEYAWDILVITLALFSMIRKIALFRTFIPLTAILNW